MATLGKVDEFDASKEEWPQYEERLTHFFQANDIDDAGKKRAVLLSVVGPVTYKLLRNLLAPAKPGEKTYDELVETLSAHYSLVSRGQTLFRAGRYRLQYKRPLSEGLEQFTGLKFTRITSGR